MSLLIFLLKYITNTIVFVGEVLFFLLKYSIILLSEIIYYVILFIIEMSTILIKVTIKLTKIFCFMYIVTCTLSLLDSCRTYSDDYKGLIETKCRFDFIFHSFYHYQIFDEVSGLTGKSSFYSERFDAYKYALTDLFNKNNVVKKGYNCFNINVDKRRYTRVKKLLYCYTYKDGKTLKDKEYNFIIEYDTNGKKEYIFNDYNMFDKYKILEEFKSSNWYPDNYFNIANWYIY